VLQEFLAIQRVMHLRVKLHAKIFTLQIAHRREGTVAASCQGDESFG
jgi:hypothetical protein